MLHYNFDAWIALIGPAGLPKTLVTQYYNETKSVLDSSEVRDALAAQGIAIIGNTPETAAQFFKTELVKHMKLVKQSGATVN